MRRGGRRDPLYKQTEQPSPLHQFELPKLRCNIREPAVHASDSGLCHREGAGRQGTSRVCTEEPDPHLMAAIGGLLQGSEDPPTAAMSHDPPLCG